MDIDIKKIVSGNWGYIVADCQHYGVIGVMANPDDIHNPFYASRPVPLSRGAIISARKIYDAQTLCEGERFDILERWISRGYKGDGRTATVEQKWQFREV